jgi:DNA topoisomerase-1
VSVTGRYGAFVQLGTREDVEKPKFASLRPHQRMDDLVLADALELFKLPRTLGTMEDGHAIKVAIGRFGPYVQFGAKKYASLKPEDDPYTITPERVQELIREKIVTEANRIIREFPDAGIQVLNGRYGPYITDGKKNGKVPKGREPLSLTLEECQAILAAAPAKGSRWGRRQPAARTTEGGAATNGEAQAAAPRSPRPAKAARKVARTVATPRTSPETATPSAPKVARAGSARRAKPTAKAVRKAATRKTARTAAPKSVGTALGTHGKSGTARK